MSRVSVVLLISGGDEINERKSLPIFSGSVVVKRAEAARQSSHFLEGISSKIIQASITMATPSEIFAVPSNVSNKYIDDVAKTLSMMEAVVEARGGL